VLGPTEFLVTPLLAVKVCLLSQSRFYDVFACVFICLLFNIFAYGNAYAYKTHEYIRKFAYLIC